MKLGLGTGFSSPQAPQSTVINDLNILFAGDSIMNGFFSDAGVTEFETAAGGYFNSVTTQDFAQGGMHLYKTNALIDNPSEVLFFWDDQAMPATKSARYDVLVTAPDPDINKSTPNACFFYIGSNDANASTESGGVPTVADYKVNLVDLFTYMKSDFPNLEWIALGLIHRYDITDVAGETYNRIRQAQLEAIDSLSFIKRAPDIYDLDLSDDLHPTTAKRQGDFANRLAKAAALYSGQNPGSNVLGPKITGASFDLDRIEATITHDGGSDLTVPASGAEAMFGAEKDSSEVSVSAITKNDGDTISVWLSDSQGLQTGSMKLFTGYGQLEGLSRTNPEVVLDNAASPLPLRMSSVTAGSDSNPIINLTSLHTYIDARASSKTFASGNDVSAIAGLGAGINGLSTTSGREPTYDSTAFNGAGALVAGDTSTHLLTDTAHTGSNGLFMGAVFEFPATIGANNSFLNLSSGGTGNSRSQGVINTGGTVNWLNNETDSTQQLTTSMNEQRMILLMDFSADEGTCNVYINGSSLTLSFDPHDNYASQTHAIIFALRSTWASLADVKLGAFFLKEGAHDAVSDPAIADIVSHFARRFSITAS